MPVFAARLLHHAPKPAHVVAQLADLCRVGGSVVVLDYVHHDDETMREQADLWLGFRAAELKTFARAAGLEDVRVESVPAMLNGKGPDAHLTWQLLVATKQKLPARAGRDITDTKHTATKRRKAISHG